MVRRLFSMTAARSFDLIGRERAQLRFIRFDKSTNKDADNKDGHGNEGFLHAVYSPLYVTMMQWLRKQVGIGRWVKCEASGSRYSFPTIF